MNTTFLLLQAPQGGGMNTFILMGLMFGVIYFFMIRPQMRRQKQEKNFQNSLQKGTRIVTISGIHGKIDSISEGTCVLETSAGKLTIELSSISASISQQRYEENKPKKGK